MRMGGGILFLPHVLLTGAFARADHWAGGTITMRCLGGNFHETTLQLFRNCADSDTRTPVDIPRFHHGPLLLHARDLRTGSNFLLRIMLP